MGEVMKEAAFSLTEAKFTMGDFNHLVLQNASKAQVKVKSRKENVAGVSLPIFQYYTDGSDSLFTQFTHTHIYIIIMSYIDSPLFLFARLRDEIYSQYLPIAFP